LGFAHLTLPGGLTIGIVDVPGHEKFVKNMAAGATGIDLVALIIAADEGVMPQTREHLEICSLLDIKHGLVIITKIDLVDKEWLNLARDDVSSFIAGTFLQDSPIVEVSSKTGEGIKDLIKILGEYTEKVPEREPGNFFRLPIDRVFTMRGFGTVVTGTTISGHIKTGSEVTIYPKRIKGKIRGIQVHHQDVPSVRSGLRTAINLQGIEKDALVRGDVVAENLNEGSNEDIVEQYIKNSRLQGVSKTELSFLANLNKKDLDKIITTLLSNNVIFQADIEKEIFIHAEFYNRAKEDTVAILSDYHRRFPLKRGLVKEELRSKIKGNVKEKPFNQLLTALIQDGAIVRNKDLIRLKDHTVTLLQDQETVRNQIEQIYLKEGLEPPYFNNLDQNIIQKGGKDLLEIMVKDGTLIKVKEDLYFHKESIEELKRRLIAFIKEKGEITTSELKQVTGVSRKYTIPLIEYFDKTQLTVRVGNKRVLRKRQ